MDKEERRQRLLAIERYIHEHYHRTPHLDLLTRKPLHLASKKELAPRRPAAPDEAPEAADPVQNIKDTMQELSDALDKSLETRKPTDTSPAL